MTLIIFKASRDVNGIDAVVLIEESQIRSSKELNLHAAVTIRHPNKVRKVVSISACSAKAAGPKKRLTHSRSSPRKRSKARRSKPNTIQKTQPDAPNEFSNFVKRVVSIDLKPRVSARLAATALQSILQSSETETVPQK